MRSPAATRASFISTPVIPGIWTSLITQSAWPRSAEAMKAVAICESANIGVSVDTNPYTMIGDSACCHIAAAIRTHYPVDCEGHVSFLD